MDKIILKNLIMRVIGQFQLDPKGFHGVGHWARVMANGRRLSVSTGANERVVCLFAVFHDSCRLNDWDDPEHGLRGAQLAAQRRNYWFEVSDGEMALLWDACSQHTGGRWHDDVTVQTCWDADRLDLGRVGIEPDPRYLLTSAGQGPEMFEWAHSRRFSY